MSGKQYRPYWHYFAWVVVIMSALSIIIGGVYALAITAPDVLGYIGLGIAALIFCGLMAAMPWLGQVDK